MRRMLADLGHDVESSVFGIIDMQYTRRPISRMNRKGLLVRRAQACAAPEDLRKSR
jgi:hypothetical protein